MFTPKSATPAAQVMGFLRFALTLMQEAVVVAQPNKKEPEALPEKKEAEAETEKKGSDSVPKVGLCSRMSLLHRFAQKRRGRPPKRPKTEAAPVCTACPLVLP